MYDNSAEALPRHLSWRMLLPLQPRRCPLRQGTSTFFTLVEVKVFDETLERATVDDSLTAIQPYIPSRHLSSSNRLPTVLRHREPKQGEKTRRDTMDELCSQLSAFHISVRLQRLAETEDLGHQPEGLSLLGELPFAAESEHDFCRLVLGELLPSPWPGSRPVWVPPECDYSVFEVLIEAQKELNVKEGGKEISWRVDAMDNMVEEALMGKYSRWIHQQKYIATNRGNGEDFSFWAKLWKEVDQDWDDVVDEMDEIMERHGKSLDDWQQLRDRVAEIATVKDANFGSSAVLWW